MYFEDAPAEDDRRLALIHDLAAHFAGAGWPDLAAAALQWQARTLLDLDWQQLVGACGIADLPIAIETAPAELLACIGAAAFEVGAGQA